MITEKAYAKINLILDVTHKRTDGYHDLNSIMMPLDFYDELTFEVNDQFLLISNFNLEIKNNIITKTYKLMKEIYDIKPVKITLQKNIPTEAGLAGGSADCSATIRGINKLYNLNLSLKEQENLANSLGSDTLFCLYNKPALLTSRGDFIEFINSNASFYVLLIKPDYGFSTKEIFNNFRSDNCRSSIEKMKTALFENNTLEIENNIFNNLQPICFNLSTKYYNMYKSFNTIKKCFMSGSGSTLFMISNDKQELLNIMKMLPQELLVKLTNTL